MSAASARRWYGANKATANERARRWAAANPDKARAAGRRHYAANRDKRLEESLRWQATNPDKVRENWRRQKRRGLPEATRPCPAVCEVCGDPPGKKSLALDHCHTTGKFRGWLCIRCNMALGLAKDSTERLKRLCNYLKRALKANAKGKWLAVT